MEDSAKSEDPVTNLALNLAESARALATHHPPVTGPADPNYFNVNDVEGLTAVAGAIIGDEPTVTDVRRTHQVLTSLATDEAAATPSPSAPSVTQALSGLTLEGTTPNVLSGPRRWRVAVALLLIAGASILAAIGVYIGNSERLALMFVGLAAVAIILAYLTVMGFGTVKLSTGIPNTTSA